MPGSLPRVIVADGEDVVCRFIREGLFMAGFDVEILADGREVLDQYRLGSHALLILDSYMERKTGLEVVSLLRDRGDGVPIVLMSGAARGESRVEPFAFTYRVELLLKPFGLSDLRAAVARATGQGDEP